MCLAGLFLVVLWCGLGVNGEQTIPGCDSVESAQQRLGNVTSADIDDLTGITLCFCGPATIPDQPQSDAVQINCFYGAQLIDFKNAMAAVSKSQRPLAAIFLEDLNFSEDVIDLQPIIPNGFFDDYSVSLSDTNKKFLISSF